MSEDFGSSPRATKRRRTTRHSDQRIVIEDGEKDHLGTLPSDVIVEQERLSVDSDTIEVHSSTKISKSSSKKSGSRQNARTNNSPLSGDGEVSTPASNGSKTRVAARHMDTSGQEQRNESHVADSREANTAQMTRSSGRTRKPPKRLADSLDAPTPTKTSRVKSAAKPVDDVDLRIASPAPKGILTPSRKQKPKTQKSVAFNHEDREIEEQLGFRDIDTPVPKKLPQKSTPYPSRSLNLTKVREPQVLVDEDDGDSIADQDMTEPPIVDEMLDTMTVPVPEIMSAPVPIASNTDEDPQFSLLKHRVLKRLTSSLLPPTSPVHLGSQLEQLHSLLKSTVASSESNSLLLLGPRGAGKTMLLDLALRDLEDDYSGDFHVVRLNGFLQTDDRLALREIWRQLGYSRNLEETETEDIGASYADTMASLLSLLSHADEVAFDEEGDTGIPSIDGQRTTKSIVFILDEFDLFTTHPRQTLLYNLFDIAQSRKAPIVVIGCSSRMDVIECLEKRVKSRFSHRWILVPGCKSLSEWEAEVMKALMVQHRERDMSKLGDKDLDYIRGWNSLIETQFLPQEEVQRLVKREFYSTKSLPQLFIALYPLVAVLQLDHQNKSTTRTGGGKERDRKAHVLMPQSVLVALNGLPVLHLSLLIAMCRLEAIHTLSTVNFNLVYTHYTELINVSRLKQTAHGSITHSGSLRKWNRELCREAWEELGVEGLIVPVAGGRDEDGNTGGAELEETRMWRSEVGLEDILWSVKEKFHMHINGAGGVGEVLMRWCKEA